jgi:hypothetical protein
MRQALFKCEMPRLKLKSSRSFLAIKRWQRTKSKKVIKHLRSSKSRWAHICTHSRIPVKSYVVLSRAFNSLSRLRIDFWTVGSVGSKHPPSSTPSAFDRKGYDDAISVFALLIFFPAWLPGHPWRCHHCRLSLSLLSPSVSSSVSSFSFSIMVFHTSCSVLCLNCCCLILSQINRGGVIIITPYKPIGAAPQGHFFVGGEGAFGQKSL